MEEKQKKRRGRPRKSKSWDTKLLNDRAREYFKKCDDRTKQEVVKEVGLVDVPAPAPYTVEGLCNYLGISTQNFSVWRKKEGDFGDKARLIHQRITDNRVTGALDGTQNSSFARFMLTNNAPEDYKEKVQAEITTDENTRSIFEAWTNSWQIKQTQ